LQKGGRIGSAAALLGNLIKLAPVLSVCDGGAITVAKIRTRKKALERIVEIVKADIADHGLKNLVVHYIGDKWPATLWAKQTVESLLGGPVRVVPVSPVIGMHVGPAIGIAYQCSEPITTKFSGKMPPLAFFS
jgi:DegV family protein with EDD domain